MKFSWEHIISLLIILLLISLFCRCWRSRQHSAEMFCPCGVDLTRENLEEQFCNKKTIRYPLSSLYTQSYGSPRGEPSDNVTCPYYKRSWPVCTPCGNNTDLNCQTQAYIEPENFSDFPRDSLSCQPSCEGTPSLCANNPYGQNYEDPRWKNGRFWSEQEWAPGLPGEPANDGWYPIPNMTS